MVAEFAHRVKAQGIYDIYLEVTLPSRFHRSRKMRADAVLTHKGTENVAFAVEFKKPGKTVGPRSRQRDAYSEVACPVHYCVGFKDIEKILGC